MKSYIKSSEFDGFGNSNNPEDRRTNYKYYLPDLDIDGTVEELFKEVLNNYVVREDSLQAIQEILLQNHWDEEAKVVGYYIDELNEIAKYGDSYNWSRVKIDIAQGYKRIAGFEEKAWGNYQLSCWVDRDSVIIELQTYGDPYGHGATAMPISKFMEMTPEDLESIVGQIAAYGMEYETKE